MPKPNGETEMNDRKTYTPMTGLERASVALRVASFRDQLRSGHLEPALSSLTSMERGDLVGLVHRAMAADGAIDATRLAASERDRAEAWLRSASPAVREPVIRAALEEMARPHPKPKREDRL
ncbi:MAG: hypothetical protein M3451_08300 [Chloroflexota bacterium]|nr:hypothetical protein [Acidobacteriota bacterium]MDQ3525036.1 hypothetical protein [Chloroflexota bacterium]